LADGILADASAVALERVAERRATFSRANVVAGGEGSLGSRSVVRYTEAVTNPFVESMASNFDTALRLMEVALTDCPEKLWETDLWPNEAPTGPTPHGGLHRSAPWFLAYHALLTLDYDLTAEFEPWEPPQPFDENSDAFPTVCSPRPSSSGTSITAEPGCAEHLKGSPRPRRLGHFLTLIDATACCTE
jgi:hypothetical protein